MSGPSWSLAGRSSWRPWWPARWALWALWAGAALGARLRSTVVDRVQRDGAASLAGAVPEHQLTLDFDACQQPFGGADRVRLLLNLSSGRRVPVWASCLGVTYETEAEVTEYLPLQLRLHEHGTCEGELENEMLRDDFEPEFEPVYGNTRQARAGFLAQALFAQDRGVWPADLLDNGTAGARRRLQQEIVPAPAGALMNVSLPVCGGCVLAGAGARHYTMQPTSATACSSRRCCSSCGRTSSTTRTPAWRRCCDQSGFVPPALYQAKALALHHAQARLRTATYFATRVQAAGASSSRLTQRIRNINNSPYWYGGLAGGVLVLGAPATGLAYGIMQLVLAISKRRDRRKLDLGADTDETADLWDEYMADDLTRQLVAWSPLDGRQACASAQAQHWADKLARGAPPATRGWPPGYPTCDDVCVPDRTSAKHQATRAERGYPTQWQWDPPCRPLGGNYSASAESAACRGPDSTAPGPASMYPRSFASDNRCKFVPGTADARDEQHTYECVPAQLDAQGWAEAWRSTPCTDLSEKELYCGLAADGDAARAVAAKCAGSGDRAAALRRALVDSLWVLLDDDGGGWVEAAAQGEAELATFQRYFCSAGQRLVSAQFWFRSAGDQSAVGLLAGRECPCAESSDEGLKVCPLNPWERLDPRNGPTWGRLRTHCQLQGCVRNRGLSYCVPLLDYAALRAALRQEPAVSDDRCNSQFMENLGEDPALLELSSALQYAVRQLQTLEALTDDSGGPQLDCAAARAVCAYRDGQGREFWPNSTDRDAWAAAVARCFQQTPAGETTLEFVDTATCEMRGRPGTTVPLPSFNRALITKQVYKVGTGGTAHARQYEHACKPSLVEVDGAESLRLTVARSALDVAANADALEQF
eukprot:g2259.t1